MSDVLELLQVGLLLFCLWLAGRVEAVTNSSVPSLITEIVVGMVLGPDVLDVVVIILAGYALP